MRISKLVCLLGLSILNSNHVNSFTTSNAYLSSLGLTSTSTSTSSIQHASQTTICKMSDDSSEVTRRDLGSQITASLGSLALLGSFAATRETKPTDYGLYGVLPIGPYKRKKTIFNEIVPNQIWTLDQKFGILNVQVPVRMVVVKLKGAGGRGGLFVYNPIAATPECLTFMRDLERIHGEVKHIVLGTVAIEHKVYAGVFAQKFKNAKVWLQSGQYSFPTNLPDSFLGFPLGRTFALPSDPNDPSVPAEWSDFEFTTLGPIISRDGAFGETVFLHKPTETLLVTDTVLEVSDDPPEIFEDDHKPLLYHARDTITQVVEDTPETRRIGWRRVVLFGLFFMPSSIKIKASDVALKERRPDINPEFAGIYPWDWVRDELPSFKALQGGLLVAPILQKLILNRYPIETLEFADKVASWKFSRIIPAHLANNLAYTGKDYRLAFSFLDAKGVPKGLPRPLEADFQTLNDAEINLMESGAITKLPPLPGGNVKRADIIAQTAYQCRGSVCTPKAST
mmetsp:Transcript_47972/g.57841  ORF Transcript_47972/g.57841 Transcript_47972/m.57841 type:complete len:510 (+) Transcript_47972:117-1646(+)